VLCYLADKVLLLWTRPCLVGNFRSVFDFFDARVPLLVALLMSAMPTPSPFRRRKISTKASRGDKNAVDSIGGRNFAGKGPSDVDESNRSRPEVVWGKTPGGEGVFV
jgi:hypothetical protein